MKRKIFLILTFCCTVSNTLLAQNEDFKAQTLFIYNFIKYAAWPEQQGEFIVQVYGDSPIVTELQQLASIKKTPDGQPIKVIQAHNLTDIANCHILYVANDKSKEMEAVAKLTQGKPYLIISPRDGMIKKGATVGFFLNDDDRVGFSVSRNNLLNRKIKMSGELLRMAELVD